MIARQLTIIWPEYNLVQRTLCLQIEIHELLVSERYISRLY